jgi:hypothetical protein
MLKAEALFIFDLGYTNLVYLAVNAQLFGIVKRKRERNNKPPPLDLALDKFWKTLTCDHCLCGTFQLYKVPVPGGLINAELRSYGERHGV